MRKRIGIRSINNYTRRLIGRDLLLELRSGMIEQKINTQSVKKELEILKAYLIGNELATMYQRDKTQKSIFILGTHDFGNIGDLAIGYSETIFLERNFPEYVVYNISRMTLLANWQRVIDAIHKEDIVVMPGGGNMGDIWQGEEDVRRSIVQSLTDNKIISFPQSIKYQDKNELKISASIYSSHKNLFISVRDDASYDIAKKYFNKVTVVRTEDIALSYRYIKSRDVDNDCDIIIVSRDDKEKRSGPGIEALKKHIAEGYDYKLTDTVVPELSSVGYTHGSELVYRKINELSNAKLVITDRLHGAVFALCAGLPIIVFDNSYNKISGALDKLRTLMPSDRIYLVDDSGKVPAEVIRRMSQLPRSNLTPVDLLKEDFDLFAGEIRKFISQR